MKKVNQTGSKIEQSLNSSKNLGVSFFRHLFSSKASKALALSALAAGTVHAKGNDTQVERDAMNELYSATEVDTKKDFIEPNQRVLDAAKDIFNSEVGSSSSITDQEMGEILIIKDNSGIVTISKKDNSGSYISLGEYTSEGFKKVEKQDYFFNNPKNQDLSFKVDPRTNGVAPTLSLDGKNYGGYFSLEQTLVDQKSTTAKLFFGVLYAGEKAGTSIYIEKGSKLSKYLVTQGFAFSGGKLKLTAGLLEKIMDFTFSMESSNQSKTFEDVKMKQKVAALEYSHSFDNDVIKKVAASIVFFDVENKELGYLEDIIVNNTQKYEWNKKYAGIQGAKKILGDVSVLLRVTDNLSFEPNLSFADTKYKDIGFSDGIEGTKGYRVNTVEYGAKLRYQPNKTDEYSLDLKSTETYDKADLAYTKKFPNGINLSTKAGVVMPEVGDNDYTVGIQASYSFGGASKNQKLFTEYKENTILSNSDLSPISKSNTDQIEAYKQTTWKDRIAYIDKTLLSSGDTVEAYNGQDILLLDNGGFTVTSIRSVSDTNYSSFFGVKDGQPYFVLSEAVVEQMKKDGLAEGQAKDLTFSVDDNSGTGISVYDISIEYGSIVVKKTQKVNSVSTSTENKVLNQTITMDEAQEEADALVVDEVDPIAVVDNVSISYLGTATVDVLANDSDDSGTVLLGSIISQTGVTAEIIDGKIKVTGVSGFSGAGVVTYYVLDEANNAVISTLNVTVGANQAPLISDKLSTIEVNEGDALTTNINSYLTDAEGSSISSSIVSGLDGSGISYNNGIFSGTANLVSSDTTYNLVLSVTDGELTTTKNISLVVKNVVAENIVGTISTPVSSNITTSGFTVSAVGTGVTDLVYHVYSDSGLTNEVANNTTGVFTGLDDSTTYYVVAIGTDYNEATEQNETSNPSAILTVTTDTIANVPGTISLPTIESTGLTSIDLAAGSTTGITNVTVRLYSDAGLNTLVGESTDGVFSGLTANTTYYAVTVGDDYNESTKITEEKVSSVLTISTLDYTTPTFSISNLTYNESTTGASYDLKNMISNYDSLENPSISISGEPSGVTLSGTTLTISSLPTVYLDTDYTITLTVTNGTKSVPVTFNFSELNNVNEAPTSTSISDVTQNMGTSVNIDLSSHFSDLNPGDTLVFSETGLPTGLTLNSSTGVITGTMPTVSADTPYSITIIASDGEDTTSQTFTINNIFVDTEAPSGSLSLSGAYGEVLTGNLTTGYTDNSGSVYYVDGSFSVTSGTGSFSVDSSGNYTFTPNGSGNTVGTYTLRDAAGNTLTTATVSVNVAAEALPTISMPGQFLINLDGTGDITVSKTLSVENSQTFTITSFNANIVVTNSNGGSVNIGTNIIGFTQVTITGAGTGTISFDYVRVYDYVGESYYSNFVEDENGEYLPLYGDMIYATSENNSGNTVQGFTHVLKE